MWIYYRFAIGAAAMIVVLLVFIFQYRLMSLLSQRESHAELDAHPQGHREFP